MRFFLAALVAATPTFAHEFEVGLLTIGHPVIYEGPPTLSAAAGYLTIANGGDKADRLIGVRADGLDVMTHETREQEGVARMSPVDALEIPAGQTVKLEPGGLHIMFTGVNGRALREGAKLPATLVFEHAGEVSVEFVVETRPVGEVGHHGHAPTN